MGGPDVSCNHPSSLNRRVRGNFFNDQPESKIIDPIQIAVRIRDRGVRGLQSTV